MAREKYEIKDTILAQLDGLELSESLSALWDLMIDAIVSAIYVFEKILDLFKADIEDKIAKKRIGNLDWYVDLAKEFQLGDDVVFNADGTVAYPVIDATKQIIVFATTSEANDKVYIKVAKLDNNELVALSDEEKLQLENFIEKKKVAGTALEIVSLTGDTITVEANIYYDPIYSQADIQSFLDTALFDYKTNKEDTYFVKNDFIDMLRSVTGVKDVEITTLEGVQGETTTPITRIYEVVAGYFNWDAANVYTLVADA